MRIALTGGIGAGKTTVARRLAEHGAVVIDADAIAREIVEPGQPALEEIRAAFGPDVIDSEGRLKRARLAEIVFGDPEALRRLNAIMHPRIGQRSAELISAAPADCLLVYDTPLLVEQGIAALDGWDAVVVVDAPDEVRLARLQARGLSRIDAEHRMAAQASRGDRLNAASHVIDNSGTQVRLQSQVDALWTTLTESATDPAGT